MMYVVVVCLHLCLSGLFLNGGRGKMNYFIPLPPAPGRDGVTEWKDWTVPSPFMRVSEWGMVIQPPLPPPPYVFM